MCKKKPVKTEEWGWQKAHKNPGGCDVRRAGGVFGVCESSPHTERPGLSGLDHMCLEGVRGSKKKKKKLLEFKEETCLQHRKFDYVWSLSGENIREVFSIWSSNVDSQQLLQLTDANQVCFLFKKRGKKYCSWFPSSSVEKCFVFEATICSIPKGTFPCVSQERSAWRDTKYTGTTQPSFLEMLLTGGSCLHVILPCCAWMVGKTFSKTVRDFLW